jgi:hypothetical protein
MACSPSRSREYRASLTAQTRCQVCTQPLARRDGAFDDRARHSANLHGPGIPLEQAGGGRSCRPSPDFMARVRCRRLAQERLSSFYAAFDGATPPCAATRSTCSTFTSKIASSRFSAGFPASAATLSVVATLNESTWYGYEIGFPAEGQVTRGLQQ